MAGRWKRPAGWPTNTVTRLVVDGHEVYVSAHAARRWALRVRSDPRRQLKHLTPDIRRIARACASLTFSPPPWVRLGDETPAADSWLTFGPEIVMPVRNMVAVTTMVRGSLPPEAREHRNERRRARAAAKRMASKEREQGGRARRARRAA